MNNGGVTIGENAIEAAGAVVNKDVHANTIVGGINAGDKGDKEVAFPTQHRWLSKKWLSLHVEIL